MMRFARLSGCLLFFGLSVTAAAAGEGGDDRVRATFFGDGTFATEDDCKSLRQFESTGSYAGDTLPRLLTAEGAKVSHQVCHFSSIVPRGAGHHVELSCRGGCETYTEAVDIAPHAAGGFEISSKESDKTLRLVRCEPAKPKTPMLTH